MSENIATVQDLREAFAALWEDLDEKLEELTSKFKSDLLRDIMKLVINKRDANDEEYNFQQWFGGLMGEAAGVMARTDIALGKTQQECLVDLWETLKEEIGDLVPAAERHAWSAQAIGGDGWVVYDPDLCFVQKAA